jgi:glycine dehydrogenase subunit 1
MLSAIGRKIRNNYRSNSETSSHFNAATLPQQLNRRSTKRHLLSVLKKNSDGETNLNFLAQGAGNIMFRQSAMNSGRTEFFDKCMERRSSDHGRNQAFFEFSSQLGDF